MTILEKRNNNVLRSGFTLIEIVVAVGIFSVLVVIIVGIFSRFIFVQRRDIAEQKLQEDLRFSLELFNREARTAYGTTFSASGSQIYFANQDKRCVTYRWQGQSLLRAESDDPGPACDAAAYPAPGTSFEPVVSSDVTITDLVFTAHPAAAPAGQLTNQAFITISLEAQARHKADKAVALQSTVASRQLVPFTAP